MGVFNGATAAAAAAAAGVKLLSVVVGVFKLERPIGGSSK